MWTANFSAADFWDGFGTVLQTSLMDGILAFGWWLLSGRPVRSALRCFFFLGLCWTGGLFYRQRGEWPIVGAAYLLGWMQMEIWIAMARLRASRADPPSPPAVQDDPDRDLFEPDAPPDRE